MQAHLKIGRDGSCVSVLCNLMMSLFCLDHLIAANLSLKNKELWALGSADLIVQMSLLNMRLL